MTAELLMGGWMTGLLCCCAMCDSRGPDGDFQRLPWLVRDVLIVFAHAFWPIFLLIVLIRSARRLRE